MQRFLSFIAETPIPSGAESKGWKTSGAKYFDNLTPKDRKYNLSKSIHGIEAGSSVETIGKPVQIGKKMHIDIIHPATGKTHTVPVDHLHKPNIGRAGTNPEKKEDTAISKLDSQIKKAVEFHGRAITIYNNDGSTYQATGARKVAAGDYRGKKPKADVLIHNEGEPVDFKSHKSSAKPSEQQNYEGLSAHTGHPQANSFINDLTNHTHGIMPSGASHGRELDISTPQGKNLQKSVMFGSEHGSKNRGVNNVSSIEHGEMNLVPHPNGIPGHYIIQSEKSIHNDKSFKPENHPLKFIARYASGRNDHGIEDARVGIGPASSRKTTEIPK